MFHKSGFIFLIICYIIKWVSAMEYEFKTLQELYNKIRPALTSKIGEFKKLGMNYITEADIWNYLTKTKWVNAKELTLSEMVSNVFNSKCDDIFDFIMKSITKDIRKPDFND